MDVVYAQSLEELPVASLRASSTNPRRSFDEAALAELAASIAEHGLQVPMLARPLIGRGGDVEAYEVIAGGRRLRAVMSLGVATVPCFVRDMTDAEAREIQIVENLQRADVPPVEEAEAFDALLQVLGSVAAVAAKVSKPQSHVAKALRLTQLTPAARDAMRAGLIAIDHALLLARLAHAEQNAALKWCLDRNAGSKTTVETVVAERTKVRVKEAEEKEPGERRYFHHTWEAESPVRLKAYIEAETGILLGRAPWSLTDEDYLLPDVGPCSECPKNTRANAPLFGDLQMGEATCTDGACFAAKTEGWVQIERRKAGYDDTAKPKVLVPRLSWKSSTVKPSIVEGPMIFPDSRTEIANPEKLLKYGQWIDAKPGSCPNVRMGVTVDWSDAGDRGYMGGDKKLRKPGEAVHVCIAVGCKVHPKAWEKAKPASRQAELRDPEAAKRLEAERVHLVKVENEIRSTLLNAILCKLDDAKAIRLVAENLYGAAEWRKRLLDVMPDLSGPVLEAFTVFCCEFNRYILPNGWQLMQHGGVASDRKHVFDLAKKVGVDPVKVVAGYFHAQGSIAPASDRLYPKGVPWPKDSMKQPVAAAKKAATKKSVVAAAPVKKGAKAKPVTLSADGRKRVADAVKKDVAARMKKAAKKRAVA